MEAITAELKERIARRAAGEQAKVIEGTIEPTAVVLSRRPPSSSFLSAGVGTGCSSTAFVPKERKPKTLDAIQRAVRDALIAFMAATAQAQAEATKEAQRAGIAHAQANGGARAYKGRKPSYSRKQFESLRIEEVAWADAL